MDWESGMDSWRCKMCGDDMQARGGATGLCWRQHLEETAAPKWVAVAIVVVATTRGALFLAKKTTLAQMGIEV